MDKFIDDKFIEKFFCLDVFYCVVSLYLIILIFQEMNILDILYYGVFNFYYIKIKLHRRKCKNIAVK